MRLLRENSDPTSAPPSSIALVQERFRQLNNSDPTSAPPSSIALLQERFRQFHRVKKMRQKQDRLRRLSHVPKKPYDLYHSKMKLTQYNHGSVPSGCLFFHFLPIKTTVEKTTTTTTSRPITTTTISDLVSDSAKKSFELETPIMTRHADRHQICARERNIGSTTSKSGAFDSDDIDTSLHL